MKSFTVALFGLAVAFSTFGAESFDLMNNPGRVSIQPVGKPKIVTVTNKDFYVTSVKKDWTSYECFDFEAKNNSKSEIKFFMRFVVPGVNKVPGFHYFYHNVTLKVSPDWQKFSCPLNKMLKNRQPEGWKSLDRIDFCIVSQNKKVKDLSVSFRNIQLVKKEDASAQKPAAVQGVKK